MIAKLTLVPTPFFSDCPIALSQLQKLLCGHPYWPLTSCSSLIPLTSGSHFITPSNETDFHHCHQ